MLSWFEKKRRHSAWGGQRNIRQQQPADFCANNFAIFFGQGANSLWPLMLQNWTQKFSCQKLAIHLGAKIYASRF